MVFVCGLWRVGCGGLQWSLWYLHSFHPEHVANAFTYDDKHTIQHVLHERHIKVSIYTGSGTETHGK